MAQLVEQLIRNEQAVGSSPTTSSKKGLNFKLRPFSYTTILSIIAESFFSPIPFTLTSSSTLEKGVILR